MHIESDKDLQSTLKKHLRAGITPAQFGMDALRIDEMRHGATYCANGGQTGSGVALSAVFARRLAQVGRTVERLRDALLRLLPSSA